LVTEFVSGGIGIPWSSLAAGASPVVPRCCRPSGACENPGIAIVPVSAVTIPICNMRDIRKNLKTVD
jgi:hypothetical protein